MISRRGVGDIEERGRMVGQSVVVGEGDRGIEHESSGVYEIL